MKILLIRPPVPRHTIGLKHIMICEPLELEYVAAAIHGHQIQILDLIVETGLEKRVKTFSPDLVISSCYKSGTNEVIKIFRQVKSWKPTCITFVGGVHATLVPEDFADVATDIIGMGDGTITVAEVVTCLETGGDLMQIPGLAFPMARDQLKKTSSRTYMPPPDSLPFPRRDLVAHLQHKYYYLIHKPVATMKTAWGCWYKCNFCFTWKITGGTPYFRSAESIVAELKTLQAKEVYIVDDIFLIKPSRLKRMAELIRENGIRKSYMVYARADFIAEHEDIVAEWASLGLKAVFIGLEAGTDAELEAMNKECSVNHNRKAIAVLQKYGVDTYGSLIPGNEYEEKAWQNLWNFIRETGLYYVNISPATPLPGAENYSQWKDQLTVPEDAHGLFDLSHMLLPTRMPLKKYYRSLLWLYARTILNLRRADRVTQRTLPSIWNVDYFKVLWGSLKIGWQFWNAHHHHSAREIAIARWKGTAVPGLDYDTKFGLKAFRNFTHKVHTPETAEEWKLRVTEA